MLPLYQDAPTKAFPKGHMGLWHAKFFNGWPEGFGQQDTAQPAAERKRAWLQNLCGTRRGERAALKEAQDRRRALTETRGGRWLELKTEAPLVTGIGLPHPVETNLVFHPTLGVPYVPASSLKGAVRAWARLVMSDPQTEVDHLFGRPSAVGDAIGVGAVSLLDAVPSAPVTLGLQVMTPHYGPWYQKRAVPGDWMDPTPVSFLAVEPGATFGIGVLPRAGTDPETLNAALTLVRDALNWLGVGAKTGLGYGQMRDATKEEKGKTTSASTTATPPAEKFPVGSQCLFGRKLYRVVGSDGNFKRDIAPIDEPTKKLPVLVQKLRPLP